MCVRTRGRGSGVVATLGAISVFSSKEINNNNTGSNIFQSQHVNFNNITAAHFISEYWFLLIFVI